MLSLLRISHIKILKSPSLWISLVFIIFFMAFAPGAFSKTIDTSIPDYELSANAISLKVASAIIITGLLITVVTSFGESFVKIKESLIYQNILLSNKPKYQFYIATIVPVFVYSMLVFGISILFLILFDNFGLLSLNPNVINWSQIQVGFLVLALISTVFLGVSISLLFSAIAKTENTYTALTWAYLFLVFFFGGSSVPIFLIRGGDALEAFMYISFLVPNTFSNFLFVNSIVGEVNFDEIVDILDVAVPLVLPLLLLFLRQVILLKKR